MRNVLKKYYAKIIVMVFVVSMISIGTVNDVHASAKSEKKEALNAYKEFLYENKWIGDGELGEDRGKAFAIKDVNGDKIPELLVDAKKEQVVFGYSDDGISMLYCSWTTEKWYYNKTKKCFISKADPMYALGGKSYSVYKLKKPLYFYDWSKEDKVYKNYYTYFELKEIGKYSKLPSKYNKMSQIKFTYKLPAKKTARVKAINKIWKKNHF